MDKKFEKILLFLMAAALLSLPIIAASAGESPSDHPGIMRFHVIANSDSEEDQALKLVVRDKVLEKLQKEIAEAVNLSATSGSEASHSQIMRAFIEENSEQIEAYAQEVVTNAGFNYSVAASIGVRHIPAKTYDELYFPEGNYEALTITLGQGAGQNWWCVVFPPLCLIDSAEPEYSEEYATTEGADLAEEEKLLLKFRTQELLNDYEKQGTASICAIYQALQALQRQLK